jgi:hypothetical protein
VVVVVMNLRDGEEMRSRSVNLSRDENWWMNNRVISNSGFFFSFFLLFRASFFLLLCVCVLCVRSCCCSLWNGLIKDQITKTFLLLFSTLFFFVIKFPFYYLSVSWNTKIPLRRGNN